MARGVSKSITQNGQGSAALLPLGNVVCGVLYHIASFIVMRNAYTQAVHPDRWAVADDVSDVFMVCVLGLVIGTIQAGAIRNYRCRAQNGAKATVQTVEMRWILSTVGGYLAWIMTTKAFAMLFTSMLSSLESYTTLATDKIFSLCLLVLVEGVIIPGLIISYAQCLALPFKTDNAFRWPLVQTFGLFVAIALPTLLPASVAYIIAAANPGADGSVIVFVMFIGLPAWLLLSSILGCLSSGLTSVWLFDNVFVSRRL